MTHTKTFDDKCLGGHMDPLKGEFKEVCHKCKYMCCRNCGMCQVPTCSEFGYPETVPA